MMSINLMQRIFTFYLSKYSLKLHKWLMRHIGVHIGGTHLFTYFTDKPAHLRLLLAKHHLLHYRGEQELLFRPRKNRKKNWFNPSKCFFLSLVSLRFFPALGLPIHPIISKELSFSLRIHPKNKSNPLSEKEHFSCFALPLLTIHFEKFFFRFVL